jgi:hypothetical protein
MSKRISSLSRLLKQSSDIATLAPLVAAKRITRLSGETPAVATINIGYMVLEKYSAFGSAWMAMAGVAMRAQMQLATSMMSSNMMSPNASRSGRIRGSQLQAFDLGLESLARGTAPIHSRVKRNSRSGRK